MAHMRRCALGGAIFALLGLVTDATGAQPSKCSSLKVKAAGAAVGQLLTCAGKAVAKHVPVDASCEPKSTTAFDAAFAKADKRADCLTTASAGTVWAGVDRFVADVASAVNGNGAGPSVCDSRKLRAAGRNANDQAKCALKAVRKGRSVDTKCLMKAKRTFGSGVSKAEARGDCTRGGQTAALEAVVDAFVSDLLAGLTSPSSTTTTTVAASTTTTIPPCSCCTGAPRLLFTPPPPEI